MNCYNHLYTCKPEVVQVAPPRRTLASSA